MSRRIRWIHRTRPILALLALALASTLAGCASSAPSASPATPASSGASATSGATDPATATSPATSPASTPDAPGLGAKPWDRGELAKRYMRFDGYPLELALDEHIYGSKEASSGGSGFAGGGCGCN